MPQADLEVSTKVPRHQVELDFIFQASMGLVLQIPAEVVGTRWVPPLARQAAEGLQAIVARVETVVVLLHRAMAPPLAQDPGGEVEAVASPPLTLYPAGEEEE
jgi:hypothetical protein